MPRLTLREWFFVGVAVGAIVAIGIVLPFVLLGRELRDADEPTAQPTTTTTSATTTTTSPVPGEPLAAPAAVIAAINKGGCGNCHTIKGVPGAVGQVGPDLTRIGAEAADRKPGLSAEEYIRESILDPAAFIAPACPGGPCPAGVMPPTFGEILTSGELDLIVGFLAVLGTPDEAGVLVATGPGIELIVELPAEAVLEPFQPLPGDPPTVEQIALGRYLFFDPRLSANNSLSCSSCHQPDSAFTDGQAMSEGFPSTRLFRNTPTLYNTVFASRLYWDGRMDGGDLPTLVRDHLTEAHFMAVDGRLMVERINQVAQYVDLFEEAFGGEPSFGRVLSALTAYVQVVNSPATDFDRFAAGDGGALSADAQAGFELFTGTAGCAACHAPPLFTDEGFHDIGVGTDPAMLDDPERSLTFRRFFRTLGVPNYRNLQEDVGLYALTFDLADWASFHTPSLREVARTAPYMHDGSLATLEEVVRFYDAGGGPDNGAGLEPLGLTDAEIAQLVAFLESLSSDPVTVEAPVLPDYGLVPLGGG